jgi:hypothetical protein
MEEIFCECCGKSVQKRCYTRHLASHKREKREFKCEICQKDFTSEYKSGVLILFEIQVCLPSFRSI